MLIMLSAPLYFVSFAAQPILSGLARSSLFVRFTRVVSLLYTLQRVAPSLELSLPVRLARVAVARTRWGYAGLERVRCTSRPSVCPRPASFLPAVSTLRHHHHLHLLFLLCLLRLSSSSTLLSSSSSSSFLLPFTSSFSSSHSSMTTSPFQVAGRDALYASRCLLAPHMGTRGRDAPVYAFARICVHGSSVCACACPPRRLPAPPSRRYDTIFERRRDSPREGDVPLFEETTDSSPVT